MHLGQVATEHDVSVRDWTGFRVAAHSGAVGFVLMAFWDDAVLDEYLAGELEVFSPATMTDPEQIRARLEVVRSRGWLWSTDEYALGVTTVAAAVLDREGHAVGNLHVHGPSYRFPGTTEPDVLGRIVHERALAISTVLGFRPQQGNGD
ncbi:MAG: hypothetical protein GY925_04140 [Actinomycetia bacterium]|nr:hypothetical protein [Actinomycetes bacterium]